MVREARTASSPQRRTFNRFEQMFFAVEAALDGLGVALLPSALIVDDIAAKRLVLAYELNGMYERDYCYIRRRSTDTHKAAGAFRDWLSAQGEDSNRFSPPSIGASPRFSSSRYGIPAFAAAQIDRPVCWVSCSSSRWPTRPPARDTTEIGAHGADRHADLQAAARRWRRWH